MKLKTNVPVLLIFILALLIATLSLKEVSAACRQRQVMTDKRINVHSCSEAMAAAGSTTFNILAITSK